MVDHGRRPVSRKAPWWSLFVFCVLAATASAVPPRNHAIVSAHPLASEAGRLVIEAGGNAFDAAVAVSAALAVVEPYGSGLGGGGFWLLHRAADRFEVMIDGRERAPAAATADMYLDANGQVVDRASIDGPLAAGIPGVPAALAHIAENYGRLPLAMNLQPAIILARDGFPVDAEYRRMAEWRIDALRASPAAAQQLLVDGEVPPVGHRLRQPTLAATLQALAGGGAAAFYAGDVAQRLVDAVRAAGGIWSLDDMAAYTVREREPISLDYRGWRIVTSPPPSSGGIALGEMFNILSGYNLAKRDRVHRIHLNIEAMRRAYRDRAEYLGDPDYVKMPVAELLSPLYAAGLRASIHPDKATPSDLLPGYIPPDESEHTTHYSIIDAEGNMAAVTKTVNLTLGSGFVVAGTGFVLNNEMDDFALLPGQPNAFGLVGGDANAPKPGHRPLSSMTPSFVIGNDRVGVIGTPGGSRIITMVFEGILAFIDGELPEQVVANPRYHHQYLPDVVSAEPKAFTREETRALQAMGHIVNDAERTWGLMNMVSWDRKTNTLHAGSDPREEMSSGKVQ